MYMKRRPMRPGRGVWEVAEEGDLERGMVGAMRKKDSEKARKPGESN